MTQEKEIICENELLTRGRKHTINLTIHEDFISRHSNGGRIYSDE